MENPDSLRSFVVEAHRNGYATTEPNQQDRSYIKQIEYIDGEWSYVDQYVGSQEFIGFEVVLRENVPVWGMNYYGGLTNSTVEPEQLYSFLRRALERASIDYPYRGPNNLTDEQLTYRSNTGGSIERFSGIEEIEAEDTVVYRGEYGGGVIR